MSGTGQWAAGEAAADPGELSPASFARLARFITAELGIKMPETKMTMVQSRLLRRVRELRLESVDQYAEYFFASSQVKSGNTSSTPSPPTRRTFFASPQHFAYLRDVILPARRCRRASRFKAWSAGCSSGEEPYTLAMVLAEYAGRRPGFDFAILGTDISTKGAAARSGRNVSGGADPARAAGDSGGNTCCSAATRDERLARVVAELRQKVSFIS